MTFDLKIRLKKIEFKSRQTDLKVFLKLNSHIVDSIQNICSFSHHVDFAEAKVDAFLIRGNINSVLNHKRFIQSLRYLQEKNRTIWSGYFTYRDKIDSFVFFAPKFELLKNKR